MEAKKKPTSSNDYTIAKVLNDSVNGIIILIAIADASGLPEDYKINELNRAYVLLTNELKKLYDQNPDKTIEVPPFHENITGWYKNGPTPGELGPAIILGHVDSTRGPSVFWDLNKVNPGDEIVIEREDGQKVKYNVDRLERFDQNSFPTEEVYGNINNVGLRLITCGGTFNKEIDRYSHNTVVFASAEIIAPEKEVDFIRAKTSETAVAVINELINNN